MSQLDKVTFAPIAFWTFVIYVGSFLFTSSGVMYTLLSSIKFDFKRFGAKLTRGRSAHAILGDLLVFPLVAL